jgi:sec-independent protein translocase protein TatA
MAFIGPWEIALILIVVLIIFGPKKLPELAKGIGEAIRQYRSATEGATSGGAFPSLEASSDEGSEGEVLIKTAKRLGIETEGKTMAQISEEIVAKSMGRRGTRKTL